MVANLAFRYYLLVCMRREAKVWRVSCSASHPKTKPSQLIQPSRIAAAIEAIVEIGFLRVFGVIRVSVFDRLKIRVA